MLGTARRQLQLVLIAVLVGFVLLGAHRNTGGDLSRYTSTVGNSRHHRRTTRRKLNATGGPEEAWNDNSSSPANTHDHTSNTATPDAPLLETSKNRRTRQARTKLPQKQLQVHQRECSCWNPALACFSRSSSCGEQREQQTTAANDFCCIRSIHAQHKMGHILTRKLFHQSNPEVGLELRPPAHATITRRAGEGQDGRSSSSTMEYVAMRSGKLHATAPAGRSWNFFDPEFAWRHREAVIMRDLFDTLVSGYLYHKSGKECWLDSRGRKLSYGTVGTMTKIPWADRSVRERPTFGWNRTTPFAEHPVNGRDLCQYLAQESEVVGMHAYVNFAMGFWYWKVYTFWKETQNRQQQQRHNDTLYHYPSSTLFVCYQDFSNPATQVATFARIMEWLYPTGYNVAAAVPRAPEQYHGGHASDQDPVLRSRLGALVKQIDQEHLRGIVVQANRAFQCPSRQGDDAVEE